MGTVFLNKDGSVSSIRYKMPGGYYTHNPFNSRRSGVTIKAGNLTTRMKSGRVIGTGIKMGRTTAYYQNSKKISQLTPY